MKKLYSIAFFLFTIASFSQGGYTPFAKLRLTTAPVENNTAKQVLVRDEATGNVNYVNKDSIVTAKGNYIPLTGTEIDNPLSGKLETISNTAIFSKNDFMFIGVESNGVLDDVQHGSTIAFSKNGQDAQTYINAVSEGFINPINIGLRSYVDSPPYAFISAGNLSKGMIGDNEFDKQGDRKAFAQISDVEDANIVTEYDRTHKFSNFNIQGYDGAIVSIGDSNLEGFYEVFTGANNWFSKLIKEIQSYRGGNSEKGFINFANPSIYGYTLSGTYTNVTAGASVFALKMQPNSEISFTSSSKFVEIWFDKISTGGSLEFYYNDVLYRTISTSGSEINNYSFDETETPSTESGNYRIKCVGAETTVTALFKSLFPEEKLDNYSYMYNAIAGSSFSDFNFDNVKFMTGITPNRSTLFINALGINSIYSSSAHTTPAQYGTDLKESIDKLVSANSSMVYVMPPKTVESLSPPISEPYIDFYNVAKKVCSDNEILFIDLNVVRSIYGDAIYGSDGLHFSELGHNVIYEYVSNQISKMNLIKIPTIQQTTINNNQVGNGIQFTAGDLKFDVSKNGMLASNAGLSFFKSGGNFANILMPGNSLDFEVGSRYFRLKETGFHEIKGGLKIIDPPVYGIEVEGDGTVNSVIKTTNPGAGFTYNETYGNEGVWGSFWQGQYSDGIAFLWNNTPKMIRLVVNGESVAEFNPDKTSRFYGSSIIDGTVTASNATSDTHLVALNQVKTPITIIPDLTVGLVIPELKKYYGLTSAGTLASLPTITGNVGKEITIANKSTGVVTVFSNDGSSTDIFNKGILVSSVPMKLGTVITLFNDGVKWVLTDISESTDTGWAVYTDTVYTTGSPFTVTSSTTSTIPNNSGTVINTQIPTGVTSFYDSATSKITPQYDGDYYVTTIRFKATTTAPTAGYLDFGIDIGGSLGIQFKETKIFAKGAGIVHDFSIVVPMYTGATFLANGGIPKITAGNGNVAMYDISYQIDRTHKAK